jgi:CheY-like chemotaxis protein
MPHSAQPGHLLIVDDDADIRNALRFFFADEGYDVAEAQHGGEALAYLRQTPRRYVVLLDLNMPQMNGVIFLKTIQADSRLAQRHAYCVMTAQDVTLPIDLARLVGPLRVRIIGKPFDLARLLTVVEAAQQQLL